MGDPAGRVLAMMTGQGWPSVHAPSLPDATALLGRLRGAVGQHELLALLRAWTDGGSGVSAIPLDALGQER